MSKTQALTITFTQHARLALLTGTAAVALAICGQTRAQDSQTPTAQATNTASCMASITESKRRLFFTRTRSETRLDPDCVTAQAAVLVLAGMKNDDGTSSVEGQMLALELYMQGSPALKTFMDEHARKAGLSMQDIRLNVDSAQGAKTECAMVQTVGNTLTYKCTPAAAKPAQP